MSDGIRIVKYRELDSTNAEARRLAASFGLTGRTVIMAERQTAGRGRGGRKWLNTEGALLMTIAEECELPSSKLPLLGFAAAMAVKAALVRLTDGKLKLSVKWPNDVVTDPEGEKLCGILSESFSIDGRVFTAVGIGVDLNCSELPSGLIQPASSVYLKTGVKLDPEETASQIAAEYYKLVSYLIEDTAGFLDLYWQHCSTIGPVEVRFGAPSEDPAEAVNIVTRWGEAEDIAEDGALRVRFEDGTLQNVYAGDVSIRSSRFIDEDLAFSLLPPRSHASHKGDHGRAAMIVGSPGMSGAAVMSTAAAVRAGAGLTKALIPKEIFPAFAVLPEAMLVMDDEKADELISWASAVGIGCGMGVNERTLSLVKKTLESKKPCVIDADGLNTLSAHPELYELLHSNCVLTPHPAEMARLCGCTPAEVLADFTGTALRFAKKHGCTVLLKSHRSVVASPEGLIRYNCTGNSGLAKGGSGDVLCGIAVGMLAQGVKPFDAASLAAYLLGCSADKALELLAERFLTASDVTDAIAAALRGLDMNKD